MMRNRATVSGKFGGFGRPGSPLCGFGLCGLTFAAILFASPSHGQNPWTAMAEFNVLQAGGRATPTSTPSGTPYVTGVSLGTVRNNFTGYLGMQLTVGSTPMIVNALGRFVIPGNSQTHTLKLVNASTGIDIPGGSVSVATSGAPTNTYLYAALSSPITLAAGGVYYFVSSETIGGDLWCTNKYLPLCRIVVPHHACRRWSLLLCQFGNQRWRPMVCCKYSCYNDYQRGYKRFRLLRHIIPS